ncbi:hypothetical protein ABZV31_18295, partial [Streptomyces sp. NPDC005202]|uniref:hypothetical protein n=1 Tax=Streptomyces sp. NPDC005202 TaxID=3157021 RepID=UPI0033B0F2B8
MGSLRLTLCTGLLAAAAFAPAAHAADRGGVSVTPSSPAPGGDITLRVSGCTGRTGVASSAAFVADARLAGAEGTLVGETRVRSSVVPAAYDVKVTCGSAEVKGTVTVVAAPARPSAHASAQPATHASAQP